MTKHNTADLAQELTELTDATRRLCRLHGTLGLEYPKTAGFAPGPINQAARRTPADKKPLAPPHPQQTKKPKQSVFPSQDVAALKDTISHCERCMAEAKRPTPLFGTGRQDRPALLIIGDVVNREFVDQEESFPGPAGDLLRKMLAAINVNTEDVFQTNIIRCALDTNEVPLATQLHNCRPHLIEQIKLFRPLIICTMGQIASQTLLGTKNKLIALRGRFHQFDTMPLMATYHPSQLLQVPDLKKAAWYDLQLIQHKLKQLQKS